MSKPELKIIKGGLTAGPVRGEPLRRALRDRLIIDHADARIVSRAWEHPYEVWCVCCGGQVFPANSFRAECCRVKYEYESFGKKVIGTIPALFNLKHLQNLETWELLR